MRGALRDNGQVSGHSVEPEPGPPREARGWLPRLSASARSADPLSARQVAADIALAAAAAVASLAVAVLAVRNTAGSVSPEAVPIAGGPVWQSILPGVVARTLPGKQFDVGRMLRARIAAGLLREGINLPANLDTADPTGTQ